MQHLHNSAAYSISACHWLDGYIQTQQKEQYVKVHGHRFH